MDGALWLHPIILAALELAAVRQLEGWGVSGFRWARKVHAHLSQTKS